MGDGSGIEWTDATWNCVTGCSKVSPGCAHCYAEDITARFAGQPGWIAEHRPWTPENAEHNLTIWPERLDQPLRWRKPRMIFVNSMSDLFHELLPDQFIADVFAVMALAERHTFQVLTKRPERMSALLNDVGFWMRVADSIAQRGEPAALFAPTATLPNVWLGTSIENRRFVGRADVLRTVPAAVRFISAEPLLGPLVERQPWCQTCGAGQTGCRTCNGRGDRFTLLDLSGINWLIVGGESGEAHRPMRVEWVRDLRDAAARAGTAFMFKQWGGTTSKAGGRTLDGREYDGMPRRLS